MTDSTVVAAGTAAATTTATATAAATTTGVSFQGRTIHLVTDLTHHEQLYLYEKTRLLKQAVAGAAYGGGAPLLAGCSGGAARGGGGGGSDGAARKNVYLVFCEESTRTKDSFRNAAAFHGFDVTEVSDARTLFQKETVADAVKMLASYSTQQGLFVIRSPMEGVCRWLENAFDESSSAADALAEEAGRVRPPKPCFLNAGDGRHTHPTLEFVDAFTLLELHDFDRSSVHIALVGDLLNGRTAHSKVDGLSIFDSVTVDLVAPDELQYPVEYVAKMRTKGFTVNTYASIADYLAAAPAVARVWSFSRLQVSRFGEEARGKEDELYAATCFKPEWRARLPEGTRFLQTLPRDPTHPLVPYPFDYEPVNAYERASANGYWVRITLLGMLLGTLGDDFVPQSPPPASLSLSRSPRADGASGRRRRASPSGGGAGFEAEEFVQAVPLSGMEAAARSGKPQESTIPFEAGVVVDHIARGTTRAECWRTVEAVREVMEWRRRTGSQGVYESKGLAKGVISLPAMAAADLDAEGLKKLAALAPGCTVNVVEGRRVVAKYRLRTPSRIFNIPSVQCKNEKCVSHEEQKQPDVCCSLFFFLSPPSKSTTPHTHTHTHTQVCSDLLRVPFYVTSALKCQLPAYEVALKGELAALDIPGGAAAAAASTSAAAATAVGPEGSGHHLYVCRYCMWPHFYKDIWKTAA